MKNLKSEHMDVIRKFVAHPLYLEIKDSFVSHTPEGGGDGNRDENAEKNLGKFLGTRYVFNKLEDLAKNIKQPDSDKKSKNQETGAGTDPDLES